MELYERVLSSQETASAIEKYKKAGPIFTSDGPYVFIRGHGRLEIINFGDGNHALLEELNEVWKKHVDRRIEQLKREFMATFMQEEDDADHG
jgi:hypothetical protein